MCFIDLLLGEIGFVSGGVDLRYATCLTSVDLFSLASVSPLILPHPSIFYVSSFDSQRPPSAFHLFFFSSCCMLDFAGGRDERWGILASDVFGSAVLFCFFSSELLLSERVHTAKSLCLKNQANSRQRWLLGEKQSPSFSGSSLLSVLVEQKESPKHHGFKSESLPHF